MTRFKSYLLERWKPRRNKAAKPQDAPLREPAKLASLSTSPPADNPPGGGGPRSDVDPRRPRLPAHAQKTRRERIKETLADSSQNAIKSAKEVLQDPDNRQDIKDAVELLVKVMRETRQWKNSRSSPKRR